ncbi:MAG: RsmB/NOP family class I SAM-dependent RNA methyltransferase, partial [Vicinamibacterales bacterium]
AEDGVATIPTERAPHGLSVVSGAPLGTRAFDEGWFVVQDEASQLIAPFAGVSPGARVLDLCASPGGKTVALAADAGEAGRVVACDVRPRRVRLLRTMLRRTGLDRVPIVQVPSTGALPFGDAVFDTVLVDAPCSGLGTLRRDPDIRWSRTPEDVARMAVRQRELVHEAARLVRPGGSLVYATCSSEPDENEDVVGAFVAAHAGFVLVREHRTTPPEDALEAFYGAVIARNV